MYSYTKSCLKLLVTKDEVRRLQEENQRLRDKQRDHESRIVCVQ